MRALEVGAVAALAAAVGAAAAFVARRPVPEPLLAPRAPPDAALTAKVEQLEHRLADLEGGPRRGAGGAAGGPTGAAAPAEGPTAVESPPGGTPVETPPAAPEAAPRAAAGAVGRPPTPTELGPLVENLRKRIAALEEGSAEDLSRMTSEEIAQRAKEASEAGRTSRALRLYRWLLDRDPKHPSAGDAHFTIGLSTQDADEAISHIRAVMERHPEHGWHRFMRYYLGTAHEMKKDAASAQEAYGAYEASLGEVGDNPYFNIWARYRMAKIAEETRRDPAAAERLRREILEKWGDSDWPTVASALKETRAKLGVAEPAGK